MSSADTPAPISLKNVSVRFGEGAREMWALRDLSLEVKAGEFLSITGPSGSGKTTALNVMAGLQRPTKGSVFVKGKPLDGMNDRERSRVRRQDVAYIYQFFNLLPTLTVRENVAIPLEADGMARNAVSESVAWALNLVGMEQRADRSPDELSGGEMQRVAIARALATRASVILADEPTGNLDSLRGEEVLELLKRATEQEGRSVVLVTHDSRAAAYGDRVIVLRDGRVADEIKASGEKAQVLAMRRP